MVSLTVSETRSAESGNVFEKTPGTVNCLHEFPTIVQLKNLQRHSYEVSIYPNLLSLIDEHGCSDIQLVGCVVNPGSARSLEQIEKTTGLVLPMCGCQVFSVDGAGNEKKLLVSFHLSPMKGGLHSIVQALFNYLNMSK